MFYSRIPVPKWVDHSDEYLNKATRYFPLIGWMVGLFAAAIFYAADYLFTIEVAVLLSMVASVLFTGAFHEDGFADVCDGFGGGWSKDRILNIMKDSRTGAYGVIGAILILLLKFFLLTTVGRIEVVLALLIAHPLSRWSATIVIFLDDYVRENDDSKAKPIGKKLKWHEFLVASVFGIVPVCLFKNPWYFLMIIPILLMTQYLRFYFKKWIGGYTGDCLGATQQTNEVVAYLAISALSTLL